jgi:hypothetical protein
MGDENVLKSCMNYSNLKNLFLATAYPTNSTCCIVKIAHSISWKKWGFLMEDDFNG